MSDLSIIQNAVLRAEFLRAVDLITQTQIGMFLDRPAPDRPTIIRQFTDRLRQTGMANDLDTQVSTMRSQLNETLGMFNDPYANYISPTQLNSYNSRRSGNLSGIGIKFRTFNDRYPVVIGVLLGGPLESSGVSPGDQIIEIAAQNQQNASSLDIGKLLKGEEGTTVSLLIRDARGADREVIATRASVKLKYARAAMLDSDIAYIKVSRFGGTTHETVARLVKELLAASAKAIVLDLRDNPGGSTRAARAIVSMFAAQQSVYCEQYKSGAMRELPRHGGEPLTELPLAVLINEKSMSSSEIVAGALQDYGRATLFGAPTYGKGLIQKVFNLKAPLGGAVRTTIAAYATPAHTLIHGVGVVPDVYVKSASHGLFVETGSLNVSDEARDFKRQLLIQRLRSSMPQEQLDALVARKDEQLLASIEHLKTVF